MRLEGLDPLPAPLLVQLVDSVRTLHLVLACFACVNPPAMPLLMRWVDPTQPLVLARQVNWTGLECLNPLPAPLLVGLLESAQPLVPARSVNWIQPQCLKYQ
jgi:hypothetical protein